MYLVFLLLWIIFNGRVTIEIVLFGLVISATMYWFICKYMDYSYKKDMMIVKKFGLILQYGYILLCEIVKANIASIKLLLSSRYVIEPVIVSFRTKLKTKTARVVLANSITITPGTITVSLENDELVVHCLDKDFSYGMADSVFVRLLERIEDVGDRTC